MLGRAINCEYCGAETRTDIHPCKNRHIERQLPEVKTKTLMPRTKEPKTLEEKEIVEERLRLLLLQVQCLQTLRRNVPAHLMQELEKLYSTMFEGINL